MFSAIDKLLNNLAQAVFTRQVDPYNREISKLRVTIAGILIFLFLIGWIINSTIDPIGNFQSQKRDEQRIADLKILEKAILDYQSVNNNQLPPNNLNGKFKVGGKDSLNFSEDNWLGVKLPTLKTVPTDPKFPKSSTAPFAYRYKTNGVSFKIDAYLETNPNNLMQSDYGFFNAPGIPTNNLARYELGTDLSIEF